MVISYQVGCVDVGQSDRLTPASNLAIMITYTHDTPHGFAMCCNSLWDAGAQ